MNLSFRLYAFALTVVALSGCASQGKPPPSISLDEPVQAQPLPEPPAPVEVVAMPEPLALPAQLKPLHELDAAPAKPEPADEKVRVSRANAEARIAPTREGYVNAIQVWPFTDGALYQVYAAPGRVTVVSLQPGEELVTVAAGDTVRWIVGDTSSGSGDALRADDEQRRQLALADAGRELDIDLLAVIEGAQRLPRRIAATDGVAETDLLQRQARIDRRGGAGRLRLALQGQHLVLRVLPDTEAIHVFSVEVSSSR